MSSSKAQPSLWLLWSLGSCPLKQVQMFILLWASRLSNLGHSFPPPSTFLSHLSKACVLAHAGLEARHGRGVWRAR